MPIWGLFAIAIAMPGVILGCRVANGRKSELFVPHGWRRGLVVPSTFLLAIATADRASRLAPWDSKRVRGE